ncbi:MAG: DUF4157 domain-containing protein [Pseudomonadota bacterium]
MLPWRKHKKRKQEKADVDARLHKIWQKDPTALGGPPAAPLAVTLPAVEHLLIQLGNVTSPFGRPLYITEQKLLKDIFQGSVDLTRIRIVEAAVANAPTTLGNQIRIRPGQRFNTAYGRATLVHETMHVWQYQNRGTRYISCSVYHQLEAQVTVKSRNAAYYNYKLSDAQSFGDYPAEEQAQIVEDYYMLTKLFHVGSPYIIPEWVKQRRPDLHHYERHMKDVRAAKPRSQVEIYSSGLMNQPRPHMPEPPIDMNIPALQLMPLVKIMF